MANMLKGCPNCGSTFDPRRAGQKYCSDHCRVSFNRKEKSYRDDYNTMVNALARLSKNKTRKKEILSMLDDLQSHISHTRLSLGDTNEMSRLQMLNDLANKRR